MNLFVAISDVHVSIKNLDVSKATLIQALNKARELNVPLVVAGDLNDGKAIMRSEWVKMLIDLFTEYSDVVICVLVGNHDLDNKNSENNSLYFLKTITNVTLWYSARTVKLNGELWGVIPYQTTIEQMHVELEKMKAEGVKRLIIHQGILSAYMGDYVVDESSIAPEAFKDFEVVLSGHYHKAQRVSVIDSETIIQYFGSPFTVNFGESNQEKFIWVVEQFDGKINLQPIMTNVRRHVQIIWDQETLHHAGKLQIIPDGSLLKVVVKGTKEFVKSSSLEAFQKMFPQAASISIVPEITKQSENRISADIIHSPLKVIDVYLEQCTTDFNKEELKAYLLKHCSEIFSKFTSKSSKSFKILAVEVENFLSFQNLKFEYTPMGLTLIEGYDEDLGVNTGAGKSTFIDAPVFGMFGETSKKLKADEVINRQAGKNLMVKTSLQADDGIYQVVRYRKHHVKDNDLFLVLPNGTEVRGKDNRETQKLIEETIGCSFDVFLKSSYFTQFGNIDRFLSASDTEKKKLISEITDLSIYDELHDAIKKIISMDEKEIEAFQIQINQFESNKNLLNSQIEGMKNKIARWEEDHQKEVQRLIDAANNFDQNKAVTIQDLKNKSAQWEQEKILKVHGLEQKNVQYLNGIEEKKKTNADLIHNNTADIAGIEFMIGELKAFPIIDVASEKTKVQNKLNLIQQLELQIAKLQSDVQHNNTEWLKVKSKINIEEKKKEQNLGTDCSFCHQPVSSEHIDKHLAPLKLEEADLQIKANQIQIQIEKIQESIKIKPDLNEQMKKLDSQDQKQYEIQYKIQIHERAIKEFIERNNRLTCEIEEKHPDIYGPQIEAAKATVNPLDAQIEITQGQVNSFAEQLLKAKEVVNPHTGSVGDIELKIQNIIEQSNSILSQQEASSSRLKFGQWWKQAIHVYIKSYLMDSCLESVNTLANEYLQTLFDGVLKFDINATTEKGSEIKEKINVTIINNGDECSYDSLSGGERSRICLAVNLSLAEVISKSSGKSFNMIFLDEILNGLDEVGKQQSMKLLKELERKYETIFIIDHAEGFKQLFSNSITVKKKNKMSSVV